MAECDPRINVESCLAELYEELVRLGVKATATLDDNQRACLEVHDRHGRSRRIHVHAQFFWFLWGVNHDERHSVFQVPEAAQRIAETVNGPGWPPEPPGDLPQILGRFAG